VFIPHLNRYRNDHQTEAEERKEKVLHFHIVPCTARRIEDIKKRYSIARSERQSA
jgi:hypothetical protein